MIKRWKHIVVGVLICSLVVGCKKDDPENSEPLDPISEVPAIEIVSISPGTVAQFDDLTFVIKYTDGDGDLGFEDADAKSLFITDNRASIVHEFHIPPLAPSGETITIEGNLQVVLSNVIVLDQANSSETATFDVYITDRAGNMSNVEVSPSVTIVQ